MYRLPQLYGIITDEFMPYSHNYLVTRLIVAAFVTSALLTLNACSTQSSGASVRHLGAPIEGYNHSRTTAINRFSVNGNGGSNVNVSSGGGQTCCVIMPVTWQPVVVN